MFFLAAVASIQSHPLGGAPRFINFLWLTRCERSPSDTRHVECHALFAIIYIYSYDKNDTPVRTVTAVRWNAIFFNCNTNVHSHSKNDTTQRCHAHGSFKPFCPSFSHMSFKPPMTRTGERSHRTGGWGGHSSSSFFCLFVPLFCPK
jgi:hypothetical protein